MSEKSPSPPRKRMPGPWHCVYNDFVGHPKWRRVANMSGVHLAFVHTIVQAHFQAAAKAKKDGWIGNFNSEDCAAATDIPSDDVAKVCRALRVIGWIIDDYIVDWAEHQPFKPDASAADRQRNKRARDKAAERAAMGLASTEEVAALEQLAELSRVTAVRSAGPKPVRQVVPFETIASVGNAELTDQANAAAAKQWLFGDGSVSDFGMASAIISENFGTKPLSAVWQIGQWAQRVDYVSLATLISTLHLRRLDRATFKNLLQQGIEKAADEGRNGPMLPKLLGGVRGGSAA
ncbi:MAG TPA: hypothetical protein VKX28_26990 [Xanthobacteraceae bacterium]|nr:hypothetical protein [Xanthobacteraceae bacterium]